jgi:hypothetical protein
MEEDGEEKDGDDELEEIEEEVFHGSQPPKKRKIKDTCLV